MAEVRIRHAATLRQLLGNNVGHPMDSPNVGHVFLLRLLDAAHIAVCDAQESIALMGHNHRDEPCITALNYLDVRTNRRELPGCTHRALFHL